MNNNNGFDLIIAVIFTNINSLGVLGPKSKDSMISFCLGEGETLPQLHLRDLHISSENFLLQDQIGQINNLTGKYIMELSKLKYIQRRITNFELNYRKFERQPQIKIYLLNSPNN